jgi:hypothetical protein
MSYADLPIYADTRFDVNAGPIQYTAVAMSSKCATGRKSHLVHQSARAQYAIINRDTTGSPKIMVRKAHAMSAAKIRRKMQLLKSAMQNSYVPLTILSSENATLHLLRKVNRSGFIHEGSPVPADGQLEFIVGNRVQNIA